MYPRNTAVRHFSRNFTVYIFSGVLFTPLSSYDSYTEAFASVTVPHYHPRKDGTVENSSKSSNKLLWTFLSLIIAVATVAAVIWQSRAFKLEDFFSYVKKASPGYIAAAVVCMLLFIFFEAEALRVILKAYGNRTSLKNSMYYSATDIYFSAVTPSATGGQPACAFMMYRDGIPGSTATVALLANLAMYTLSIFVLGALAILFYPAVFGCFSRISRILGGIGVVTQIALLTFFILLLANKNLLRRIVIGTVRLGGRLHIVRKVDERIQKIEVSLESYSRDAEALRGHRLMLVRVFLLNLAQRASQIAETAFVFLAYGGDARGAQRIFALQCYVVLGASFIPVPGSMGVTDFLMIDAFGTMLPEKVATSLELLSRTLSFYCCIVLCALFVLIRFLSSKSRRQAK